MSCLPEFLPGHRQDVEVCAGKHGIQSIFVFLQAPVSDLPVPELTFDDPEYVLHFAANRGFALLNITGPVNGRYR